MRTGLPTGGELILYARSASPVIALCTNSWMSSCVSLAGSNSSVATSVGFGSSGTLNGTAATFTDCVDSGRAVLLRDAAVTVTAGAFAVALAGKAEDVGDVRVDVDDPDRRDEPRCV